MENLHETVAVNSWLYWIGWASSIFLIWFTVWLGGKLSIRGRKSFERGWAFVLILSFVAMTTLSIIRGEFSWGNSLPIHLCGFSRLLAIGYFFFLTPTCFLLFIYGIDFVSNALSFDTGDSQFFLLGGERSPDPGGLPARWIIKSFIPLCAILVWLQASLILIKMYSQGRTND